MSFFHDVKQWLKNAEEQNEAWNKNQTETQLLNNELKQLKNQIIP
jgi:septal ring factor EnvC (AmiA/AmiB activator)